MADVNAEDDGTMWRPTISLQVTPEANLQTLVRGQNAVVIKRTMQDLTALETSYQDAFEANFGQPINRNQGDHDWVTDGSYSQFDTNTTWPRNRLGPLRREVRPFDPREEVDNRPMALYNPSAVNTTAVTPTPNNPQVIDITNDDPYLNDPSANDHELALAV